MSTGMTAVREEKLSGSKVLNNADRIWHSKISHFIDKGKCNKIIAQISFTRYIGTMKWHTRWY